ncbi:hypothetical protein ACHQM5_029967 [Ranunculus cassubicifolius]
MKIMVFVWVLFLFLCQSSLNFADESSITTDQGKQQGLPKLNGKESEMRYVGSDIYDMKKGKSGSGGGETVRRPNNKDRSGAPTILARNSFIQVCIQLLFGLFAFF